MELVERERELELLWEAFRSAQSGAGRIALVSGEAGVGKSALVRSFVTEVASRSRVRWGTCDPMDTPRPHGPLRDIATAGGGELARAFASGGSTDEIRDAFLAMARERPVASVIVIEDLHWSDEATLDLLRFVTRRMDTSRSLLILTHREDELGADHPLRALLGDLATSAAVERIALRALTVGGVRQLAGSRGIDAASLYRVTGGNPFFVTEILAAADGGSLPATVRDAVLARTAVLPPASRAALDAVALARPPVPVGLVLEVAAVTSEDVDAAVTAGVLVGTPSGLSFRHDLARQVVDETVTPARRTELHRRALGWLERQPGADPADLSHHAEGTGDAGAIVRHARRAGEHASLLGAHVEAAGQYARALRWSAGLAPDELVALLEQHSLACYVADDANGAVVSRSRAVGIRRALPDTAALGDSLRWLSRMQWVAGRNAEAERSGAEALEILERCGPSVALAMAHSNLAQLAMLGRDLDGALHHGGAAIELARALGDVETEVHALNNVGTAEYMAGRWLEGREKLARSLELALRHGFVDHAARAYCNLGSGIAENREYEVAAPHLEMGIGFCADRQQDYFGHYLRAWRARVCFERGDWVAAEQEALEVLDRPHVAAVTRIVLLTVLGRLAVRRGDLDGSADLDHAWSLAETTGDLQRTWPAAAGRAERAWWRGDLPAIDALTAATYAHAVRVGHPWAIGELAYWRWRGGHLAELPSEAAEPYRLLADDDPAAAAAWHRLGAAYEEAVALGRADELSELQRGFELARRLGAKPLTGLIAQQLRQRGGVVPRGQRPVTAAHPAGLTARQVEVLTLIVEGCSDAEIAERLFISPKTAGHHVSAVLHNLGVRSRVEAAVVGSRPTGASDDVARPPT